MVRRVQATAHRNRVRREQQEQNDLIAAQRQVSSIRSGPAPSGGEGGSGEAVSFDVAQAAHGFVVGNAACKSGGAWIKADRDAGSTAAVGIVSAVEDADNFTITIAGLVELTTAEWDAVTGGAGGLTAGEYYCLSSTAGGLSDTEPSSGIVQWLLVADSATRAIVQVGEPFNAIDTESAWALVKKTADEARNTTTTFADDAALTVALAANTTYRIRARVFFTVANATMDFKYQCAYSGAYASACFRRAHAVAGASTGTDNETTVAVSGSLPATGIVGAGSGIGQFEFDLVINTTTAGTFSIQWAQSTSDAANATVLKGSSLEYTNF